MEKLKDFFSPLLIQQLTKIQELEIKIFLSDYKKKHSKGIEKI